MVRIPSGLIHAPDLEEDTPTRERLFFDWPIADDQRSSVAIMSSDDASQDHSCNLPRENQGLLEGSAFVTWSEHNIDRTNYTV
jgi:hypothetical protein